MPNQDNCKAQQGNNNNRPNFVAEYRHYRTGKLMKARDYGYTGWPFGGKKKK